MKTLDSILAQRRETIRSYQTFDLRRASQRIERQFAFYSANLHNIVPLLPKKVYPEIFRQLHANRRLSFLDVEHAPHGHILNISGWDERWAAGLRHRPAIICTYHTGSYRLINYLLAKAGVPFSLLVANGAYRQEQQAMQALYTSLAQQAGITLDMELMDAEQPHALIQMARAAKRGRSLLVYIDGNTGTTVAGEAYRNLLQIDFGLQHMAVRKGMAALAHRLGLPIHPVLCERAPDKHFRYGHSIAYHHLPSLLPLPNESQHDFADRATRTLYAQLATFVTRQPEQWEGWLNVHNQLILDTEPHPAPDLDDPDLWATYRAGNRAYLLHRPSYYTYPVPWKLYRQYWGVCNVHFFSDIHTP